MLEDERSGCIARTGNATSVADAVVEGIDPAFGDAAKRWYAPQTSHLARG